MTKTTLKDIAKALNTTIATVSRALHDKPEISDSMKNRVKEVANLYSYKPNATALSLKFQKSYRIGVIFPKLSHYYVTQILSGMLIEAGKNGYKMLIAESNYNQFKELEYIKEFYELNVDAILILPSRKLSLVKDKLENLIRDDIPFLIIDRIIKFDQKTVPSIASDDYGGTTEGIKHLIDNGYKKIAHLRGEESSTLANVRYNAYRDCLLKNNMELNPDWVILCNKFNKAEGEALAIRLMSLENRPDAIFCISDVVAVGVLSGLKKAGIRVPEDVAVLGFSNSDLAEVCYPTLSSIHQPGVAIGKKSIRLLLSNINMKKNISRENIVMKTKVIVRESTSRIALSGTNSFRT
jgi:LacI family transcriptional regulator